MSKTKRVEQAMREVLLDLNLIFDDCKRCSKKVDRVARQRLASKQTFAEFALEELEKSLVNKLSKIDKMLGDL